MGTTRKLAIKAYQETNLPAKVQKEAKPVVSGSFFGTSVAYAAAALSTISGAAAQNFTVLLPDERGQGDGIYRAPPVDVTALVVVGATSGAALLAVGTAYVLYRAFRTIGTGHQIAPLSDVVVLNNPGSEVPQIAIEMQAPAINPKTPAVLIGVKEAFVEEAPTTLTAGVLIS